MNNLNIFVSLFVFLAFVSLSASAQEYSRPQQALPMSQMHFDRSYAANPHYDFLVRDAMLKMDPDFSFARLRALYSDTSYYDPLGDDTIKLMQKLAFDVQNSTDIEVRKKAIDDYRSHVMMHMGNIRVVAQALSFAKLDNIFGSPRFFSWLRKGLVQEIMRNGDGKTLNSAYYIITLTEETVILGQLGLSVLDTQTVESNNLFYNMHEVEDLRTGQKSSFFINTSRPMRFLRTKSAQMGTGSSFNIMRQ